MNAKKFVRLFFNKKSCLKFIFLLKFIQIFSIFLYYFIISKFLTNTALFLFKILKKNLFFFRIFLCFGIFLLSACEGPESCIEADDFGNSNKAKIIVYPYESIFLTSPGDENLCYPILEWKTLSTSDFKSKIDNLPVGSDYTSLTRTELLKYCLLGFNDYTRTTVGNPESLAGTQNTEEKKKERGCYLKTGQDRIDCYEECANGCKQLLNFQDGKQPIHQQKH